MATERRFKQTSTALIGVSDDFGRLIKGSPHHRDFVSLQRQIVEIVRLETARLQKIERDLREEQYRLEDEERKRRYAENRKKKEALDVT